MEQITKVKGIVKMDESYNYLLNMPLYSMTAEKIEELVKQIKTIELEVKSLKDTTIEEMWLKDLEELKKC